MATAPNSPPLLQNRLASLDQFRGYTVAGMFLVNYLNSFFECPFILKHHNNFCSYADTIMPQFFFAVGFSLRLSFGRRAVQEGLGRAYFHVVKRLLGLILVAILITYQGHIHVPAGADFSWDTIRKIKFWDMIWPDSLKNTWFQTLTHIAVTSLWILPVIRLGPFVRILYMIGSAGLHLWLSYLYYFFSVNGVPTDWDPTKVTGIDGGYLGFLTWTIPTMFGTLACDIVLSPRGRAGALARLFVWGLILMVLGWTLSCGTRWYDSPPAKGSEKDPKFAEQPVIPAKADFNEWMTALKARNWSRVRAEWPFIPPPHGADPASAKKVEQRKTKFEDHSFEFRKWNYWMMSQRAGSISYLTFGAGLSFAVYGLFFILADMIGLKIGVFRTLGSNALLAYVLHDIVGDAVKKYVPNDVPANVMWISFAVFFYFNWLIIRNLEKKKIYIRL